MVANWPLQYPIRPAFLSDPQRRSWWNSWFLPVRHDLSLHVKAEAEFGRTTVMLMQLFNRNGQGQKPWIDGAEGAARDFWLANSTWLPTWGAGDQRGMTVRSVKMWQLGACGS